jgi:uncharacterized protein (TIGR03118 family)
MQQNTFRRGGHLVAAGLFLMTVPSFARSTPEHRSGYDRVNLVSDIPGVADRTDSNLVNPWGMAFSPTGPLWIADNHSGVSTDYDGTGAPFPTTSPLIVAIPPPAGSPADAVAAPTGTVFNGGSDFSVSAGGKSGNARFIFATEDGTISGWNPAVDAMNAILKVDRSATGAVYKGLAMGRNAGNSFLYATNFNAGTVDVFDSSFNAVPASGAFVDPTLPLGYAPFGIANIGGMLLVTYAEQNEFKHDDHSGPGHGFIDVYTTAGVLVRRLVSGGALNSPWGLALAHRKFGRFSNALLVGNFGDGRINAFAPDTGTFLGALENQRGEPIAIQGLWGLTFGNGAAAGPSNVLFFTAGIAGEDHGLFGAIHANGEDEHTGLRPF